MVDKQEIIDMIRIKSPRLELVSFEAGKSEAWRWFKRVRVDGAVLPYAVCNGCFKPVHVSPPFSFPAPLLFLFFFVVCANVQIRFVFSSTLHEMEQEVFDDTLAHSRSPWPKPRRA